MKYEEIFEIVVEVLIDSLNCEKHLVTPNATIMGDLGAESIDFLDIVFRLEKGFNLKIPREELFPLEYFIDDPEYSHDGKITPTGITKMKELLPHIDLTEFEKNPDVNLVADLFTVSYIARFIAGKTQCRDTRNTPEVTFTATAIKIKELKPMDKVAVHPRTKEEYELMMAICHKAGGKWTSEKKLAVISWEDIGSDECISVETPSAFIHGITSYYTAKGFEIITVAEYFKRQKKA